LEATVAESLTALQLVIGRDAGTGRTPQRHRDTEGELVMRGLDPRIHGAVRAGIDMDRRVKPGDDKGVAESSSASSRSPAASGIPGVEIADLVDRLGNRLGFD